MDDHLLSATTPCAACYKLTCAGEEGAWPWKLDLQPHMVPSRVFATLSEHEAKYQHKLEDSREDGLGFVVLVDMKNKKNTTKTDQPRVCFVFSSPEQFRDFHY